MSIYLLTPQEVGKWLQLASQESSVVSMLRKLAEEHGFNKYQVASAAGEVFEDHITGEDRQVLWKWKFSDFDEGFDDAEVDNLLAHLLP
jgi:hypothetical protein